MDRGSWGTHQWTSAKPGYPPDPRVSEGQVATAYHSEPWSSSERASCVRRSQPGCLRLRGGVGAEPRLGKRLGLARGAGLGLDGQRRSKAPLCSSGSRSVRGSWRPVWGEREGNSGGYCEARARHSKLHRHQDASLWRGCFSTVIPMSRAAFSVVRLRVEKISVNRGELKSCRTRPAPSCIYARIPMSTFKWHNISTGCWHQEAQVAALPALCGAESFKLLQVIPRWWDAML